MTPITLPPIAPSLSLVEVFGPLAELAPIALGIGFAALAVSIVAAAWRERRRTTTIALKTSAVRTAA